MTIERKDLNTTITGLAVLSLVLFAAAAALRQSDFFGPVNKVPELFIGAVAVGLLTAAGVVEQTFENGISNFRGLSLAAGGGFAVLTYLFVSTVPAT